MSDEKPVETCGVDGCSRSPRVTGRCGRHDLARFTRKSIRHRESREKVRVPFPGGLYDPRNVLVDSLAAAVGDSHANTVMDALDAYLATDPIPPMPPVMVPNHQFELHEAIARAEEAERKLAAKTKTKKGRRPPKQQTSHQSGR